MDIKAEIAEKIGLSTDAVELQLGYQVILGQVETGNGASAASTVFLGNTIFKTWKVVGLGFYVSTAGTSTVAEEIEFGYHGATPDPDAFGSITQDTTADDELAAGDMYYYSATSGVDVEFAALANAGTLTFDAGGALLGVWQTTQRMLTCTKANVASSTATVIPFMVVEVA
ncbi:MAG: hypothetical protein SVM80_10795 [Halobacteriota archaeon]|nr:hypothetical protein [Halobacteriota archaeon]